MKNRKDLHIYIFFIIVSFIFGGIYFNKIYSPDGFTMLYCGVDYYNTHFTFGNMRIVEFLVNKFFLFVFGSNVEYIVLYRIYLFISLLFISTSMYMIYLKIIKILRSKGKFEIINQRKMLILFSIIILFFNKFIADNLIFLNSITMMLSMFLSVVASIIYSSKLKYKFLFTFLLLVLSVFCYQTMITSFIIFSILFYIIENKDKKISIKYIFELTVLFIMPLLVSLLTSIVMQKNGVNISTRWWSANKNIVINIIIVVYFYCLIYFLYFVITICTINKFNKDKNQILKYNLFIMLFIGTIYTLSFLITNSARISCRMAFSMGTLPGCFLIILTLFLDFKTNKNKIQYVSIMITFLIIEIVGYLWICGEYIRYNKIVNNNSETIVSYICDYNNTHEEKIRKIAIYHDTNITIQNWYSIIPHLDFEIYNVEYNLFATIKGKNKELELEYVCEDKEVYNEHFINKDWGCFNNQQFVVLDDTLHLCEY